MQQIGGFLDFAIMLNVGMKVETRWMPPTDF
jgi:hypothetical protein